MASPDAIRRAIIKLLETKNALRPEGRLPVPHKTEQVGPGPDPITGNTIDETMGIADPRYNQFQEAIIEDSAAKRLIDPESQRTSVFDESADRPVQLEREVM